MSDPISDVVSRHYPGSKQVRRAVAEPTAPVEVTEERWDSKPVVKTVRGQQIELFTIGQLGQALNGRAAVTMRLWERNGVIPKARMRLSAKNGLGGRRYYSRAQVEAIVQAAHTHGLMEPRARLTPEFTKDVLRSWAALENNSET